MSERADEDPTIKLRKDRSSDEETLPVRRQDAERTAVLDGEEPERPTEPAPEQAPADGAAPRLAEGLELLGRFEDSGYKEPPFIARRADGQVIQLPPLLYAVAEEIDGSAGPDDIARGVGERLKVGIDVEQVRFLVDDKLRPLGVVDGGEQAVKADPMLALRLKTKVVPERAVRAVTTIFRPAFFPPVILAILVGLVAFDWWLFGVHGVAQSLRSLLLQPLYLILLFGLVVVGAAFHEIGHATGLRYGGGTPGVMGVGIYIVWPAFYTDVTDSYRLGKGGRLRTDLGGVYFNAIFILATAGVYFATGFEPLLVVIVVQHLEILRQLLPVLRLDGYLILSDLTGVPDLFGRIGAILKGLIPWRTTDERATQLKPWVRAVVTLWVLTVIPFLAFNVLMILVHAPRIFATGWDSFWLKRQEMSAAFGEGNTLAGVASVIQMVALALPAVGMTYGFGRGGTRLTAALWRKSDGKPLKRSGTMLLLAGALGALAFVWWPDGDYKPIQPNERWTATELASSTAEVATGQPAFADVPSAPLAPLTDDGTGVAEPGESEEEVVVEEEGEEVVEETSPTPIEESPTESPSPVESPTEVVSATPTTETTP